MENVRKRNSLDSFTAVPLSSYNNNNIDLLRISTRGVHIFLLVVNINLVIGGA